ncbi:MAG: MBL fold metallo-hydrolase [Lentisphaeria bacterium]|nr:MBL fold metallo-hydrolase [Lentisphaeria bacterium]
MRTYQPWEEDLAPFQLYGKLWHIGGKSSPSYLFDTGDGLLLLDTGLPGCGYFLFRNIYDLGFNPRDIRWILHSHGHFDHVGMTRSIVEMTGAKTCIGAPDRDFVNGKRDIPRAKYISCSFDDPFEPDLLINGGETLIFGNLEIRCEAAPGHTPGTMAFFFDLEENGVVRRAGMHGGVGINAMRTSFLQKFGLSSGCRRQFLDAVEKLMDEPVEIPVGNHLGNNNALSKVQYRKDHPDEPNPFVDPAEWKRFLAGRAELVRKLMVEDPAD